MNFRRFRRIRPTSILQSLFAAFPVLATYTSRVGLLTILLILFPTLVPNIAEAIDADEYQIKAAYLYQFTQFVDWPASSFKSPDANFELCVIGEDTFGVALSQLAQRTHESHPIILRFLNTVDEVRGCHLLYLSTSEAERETALLAKTVKSPVLTVSSLPDFVEQGGIIGFVRSGNHVRFTINRGACEHQGLTCSAKLLEVAVKIVDDESRDKTR